LYALLLPALAYAIFGSSRQVIVGPDGSVAALVGSAVIPLAADPADRAPLAALLRYSSGGVSGAWLARLGWIADYFSDRYYRLYRGGCMIIGQLDSLLGLSISDRLLPPK
jgi:MFS superfamily sulfate permease-like transporter